MSGKLSTHVLDTAHGKPAHGVKIELWREGRMLKEVRTNTDGRTDEPLLEGEDLKPGTYQLVFFVREYFSSEKDSFLVEVPVRFCIKNAEANYHVPLLVSPWSYTTYRGS